MKKLQKILILAMLIGPILFVGCQKADINEQPVQTPADDVIDNTTIENKDYCGNTMTFTLENAFYNYGHVTIGNDESNLILNFELNDVNDYIQDVRIFVINEGLTPPLGPFSGGYVADAWDANMAGGGTGHFWSFNFPFITTVPNTTSWQEVITFSDLEAEGINLDECISIVAIAYIYDQSINFSQFATAKPALKTTGWFVNFCIEPCEEPTCETVYAYGGDLADCFLNFTNSNNWGWTNGPISDPSSYEWDIYAGAGQCDLDKGTKVGILEVTYSGGIVDINYNIFTGYTLDETHVHIGDADNLLPWDKTGTNYKTAPGQYNYNGVDFPVSGFTGDIYITAHGVVCGDFE